MSLRDVKSIVKNRGRLCIDPSDLSVAFPHGGTALGTVKNIAVADGHEYFDIEAEEMGVRYVESVQLQHFYVLAGIARGFDDDMIDTIQPNSATGSVTGKKIIQGLGAKRAGALLSASSVVLFFSPDDPRHRAAIFYKALPKIGAANELLLSVTDEADTTFAFLAIDDDSGKDVNIGRIEDLTL